MTEGLKTEFVMAPGSGAVFHCETLRVCSENTYNGSLPSDCLLRDRGV